MKDPMYKLDIKPTLNYGMEKGMNYGMEKGLNKGMEASPLEKHSSGIGPANLGGPGVKSHVHACGTPKMSSGLNDGHSGLNDGHEDTTLPKLEDLDGSGDVTKKDFLIGAGVIDKEGNKIKK